jgi:hypothetical protein
MDVLDGDQTRPVLRYCGHTRREIFRCGRVHKLQERSERFETRRVTSNRVIATLGSSGSRAARRLLWA